MEKWKKKLLKKELSEWANLLWPIILIGAIIINSILSIGTSNCTGDEHPEECDPNGYDIIDRNSPDD